jgi:hypothetical protein
MSGLLGNFSDMSVSAAPVAPSDDAATLQRHDATPMPRPAVSDPPSRGGVKGRRPRGQGATVALTLRLERKDWARLHEVAVADGLALADLLREGLNRALAARGLPPVDV